MSRLLDGAADFLEATHVTEYDITGDFSIALWIKLSSSFSPLGTVIMRKSKPDFTSDDWVLHGGSDGQISFFSGAPGPAYQFFKSSAGGPLILDNNWRHVGWSSLAGIVTFYIDGVNAGTGSYAGVVLGPTVTASIILGQKSTAAWADFHGNMSQVHFYNSALTSSQMNEIRNSPNSTAGIMGGKVPIGYWALNAVGAGPMADTAPITVTHPVANDMVVTGATHSALEPPVTPNAPTALSGVAGDLSVVLNWTVAVVGPGPGITEQRVYRRLSSDPATYTFLATVASAVTNTYTDGTASNGSTYFYIVRAYNGTESGDSNATAAMSPVSATGAPNAPTGLIAAPGDTTVTLTWLPNPAIAVTSQKIYRSTTAGSFTTALPAASALGPVVQTFTDVTVSNGTPYYYVVRAVAPAGESGNSNPVQATPQSGAIPQPQTNFIATPGDGLVSFFWSRSTSVGITQQRIYRATSQGGTRTMLPAINDNVTQIATDLTASNGTSYWYWIRTYNGSVESGDSAEQGPIVPNVDAPPLPPTNLQGVAGNGRITLTWEASITPLVTQQLIFRSTQSGNYNYSAPIVTFGENATEVWTDENATNGVPFFYVIKAAY